MRSQLWLHRDVQILQGFITRYVYSSKWITKDRAEIHWQWNNIQKDMEKLLKEVDDHVAHSQSKEIKKSP